MNKCIGCGVRIKENKLCERCFRIKNYNDYQKVDVNESDFLNIIDNISKDDLVVLVVDLLNIPENFELIKKHLDNKLILVLTKFDLMPTKNEKRYLKYFDRYELNVVDKIVISSIKNYNLDILYQTILNNLNSNKVYFIGYTNAGKSTLINKFIYNYTNKDIAITTSCMPNTTLDTISIKLEKFTLVDTPGIVNKGDITNYLDNIEIKKLMSKGKIKPINYQVKGKQYLKIDNFLNIELNDNNIIIYMPANLKINRYYKKIDNSNLQEVNIKINNMCDIVIPGLGFIKVVKKGNIKLFVIKGVNVFIRDNII